MPEIQEMNLEHPSQSMENVKTNTWIIVGSLFLIIPFALVILYTKCFVKKRKQTTRNERPSALLLSEDERWSQGKVSSYKSSNNNIQN